MCINTDEYDCAQPFSVVAAGVIIDLIKKAESYADREWMIQIAEGDGLLDYKTAYELRRGL